MMSRRIWAYLLTLCMLLTMIPTVALGEQQCAHSNTVEKDAVAATCVATGLTAGTWCNDCGTYVSGGEIVSIDASNHAGTINDVQAVAATCVEGGFTAGKQCDACDAYTEGHEPTEIDASNHAGPVNDVAEVSATCGAAGTTAGKQCAACSAYTEGHEEIPATGEHEYVDSVVQAATCTDSGVIKRTCSVCGDNKYQSVPAAHTWGAPTVIQAATCGKDGKARVTCTKCGEKGEIVLPATGEHDFQEGVVEPTCTTPEMAGQVCTVCGATNGQMTEVPEGRPALDHDLKLVKVITKATCTQDGLGNYACTRCDHTEEKAIPATQHQWGEEEFLDADCTHPARVRKVCSVCEEDEVTTVTGELAHDPLGHDWDDGVEMAATCKVGAHTLFTCSRCHETEARDAGEPDPTAHQPVLQGAPLREPTCTVGGIGRYVCALCETDLGYRTIPAAHTWGTPVVTKPATCGADGVQEYPCTKCDQKKQEPIPATGDHNFVHSIKEPTCTQPQLIGMVCSVCGETSGEMKPVEGSEPLDHDWVLITNDEYYKAPTCFAAGQGNYACSRCDATKDEQVLPQLEHIPDAGTLKDANCDHNERVEVICTLCKTVIETVDVVGGQQAYQHNYVSETIAATCQSGSYTLQTCTKCGDKIKSDVNDDVDPNAHQEALVSTLRQPTCTANGIGKYKCELCKADLGYKTIPAAHKWGELVVITAPTCGTEGLAEHTCSECGTTEKVEIPATGAHDFVEGSLPATCTEPAKAGVLCSVCKTPQGELEDVVDSEPLDHDYVIDKNYEQYEPSTCSKAGYGRFICTRCDDKTQPGDLPLLDHTPGEEVLELAGCVNNERVVVRCTVCKTVLEEQDVAGGATAFGHEYTPETFAPTCQAAGYTKYTCKHCDDTYQESGDPINPNAHKEVLVSTLRAPNCKTNTVGIGSYKCELCETSLGYKTIPVAHTYGEGTVITAPTCGKAGLEEVTCTVCEEKVERPIPATGEHNFVEKILDATCTQPMMAGKACTVCEAVEDEMKPVGGSKPLGHNYQLVEDEEYVAATCTKDGYGNFVCTRCDTVDENHVIASPGHTPGAPVFTPADCENPDRMAVICTECDTEISSESIEGGQAALNHNYELSKTVAPTCTNTGYTLYICSRCKEEDRRNETAIVPTAHVLELVKTLREPDCKEKINGIGKFVCAECKDDLGYRTIPYEHTYGEWTVTKEATCGVNGEMVHTCAVCGHEETEVITASGEHKFAPYIVEATCKSPMLVGEKCSVCQTLKAPLQPVGEPGAHTYEPVPATAPTCTEDGTYTQMKCSVCGDTKAESGTIPALGHDLGEATVEGQFYVRKCSRCDYEERTPLDHEHTWATEGEITKAATCTEEGEMTYKCTVEGCPATRTEPIEKIAHAYGEGVVTTPATETEPGEMTFTCTVCGATRTEIIPATGVEPGERYATLKGRAPLRKTPEDSGELIIRVVGGTRLLVTGEPTAFYYPVRLDDGTTGYIYESYLIFE